MKKRAQKRVGGQKKLEQPEPFAPGLTKAEVRQHAYALFRDKLPEHPLTFRDWVLTEKDLVSSSEVEEVGDASRGLGGGL